MKSSGIFITFEGTEGAGKSTLIREVAERLQEIAPRRLTIMTREPGGTPVAERIRGTILEEKMDPWTELFLYEAARAEHLAVTLLPALERGDIVLCDRFTDSTLAYQAHARGLPWNKVKNLNHAATRGLKPHLTVLLDIDPEEGLRRAQDQNRFEAEGVKFQTQVRAGFLKARKENPSRWLVLKVHGKSPQVLAEEVVKVALRKFKKQLRQSAQPSGKGVRGKT